MHGEMRNACKRLFGKSGKKTDLRIDRGVILKWI